MHKKNHNSRLPPLLTSNRPPRPAMVNHIWFHTRQHTNMKIVCSKHWLKLSKIEDVTTPLWNPPLFTRQHPKIYLLAISNFSIHASLKPGRQELEICPCLSKKDRCSNFDFEFKLTFWWAPVVLISNCKSRLAPFLWRSSTLENRLSPKSKSFKAQ